MGCTYVKERKETELWLIDPQESILYRVIEDNKEEVIPIKNNNAVKRFMCVSGSEYDGLIVRLLRKER
jgi:hypothetical protein